MASTFSRAARAFVALIPLAAIACAGSTEEGTQGDDQNVKASSKIGDPGTMCGGIAGIKCKAGLACRLTGSHPDSSGTCASGLCGGIAGFRCKAGLRCDLTGKGFDVSGICAVDSGSSPPVTCLAMPSCQEDEETTSSCALKDTSCTTRSMCGKTINCKRKAPELTIEGTLERVVAIGGETTGFAITTAKGSTELALDSKESKTFVEGRFARVKGRTTTLKGVEIEERAVLDVSDILVCPDAKATLDCMPPVEPEDRACGTDRKWVEKNCGGVRFLD